MSTSCSNFFAPSPKNLSSRILDGSSICTKSNNLFTHSLMNQGVNEQFSSNREVSKGQENRYLTPLGSDGLETSINSVPATAGDLIEVVDQLTSTFLDTAVPEYANDTSMKCNQNDKENLNELQPWKKLKIYTVDELEELSLEQLRTALEALHCASQGASVMLVTELQSRHQLDEELELRNVAIEQLLRRAERHAPPCCPPSSPGMVGRG